MPWYSPQNWHPPGYKYLGPLTGGDNFAEYVKNNPPKNSLDRAAMKHDIAYNTAILTKSKAEIYIFFQRADQAFIDEVNELMWNYFTGDLSLIDMFYGSQAVSFFMYKKHLVGGINLDKPKYTRPLPDLMPNSNKRVNLDPEDLRPNKRQKSSALVSIEVPDDVIDMVIDLVPNKKDGKRKSKPPVIWLVLHGILGAYLY